MSKKKDDYSASGLHSNKVYQALQGLNGAEQKRLIKYLNSPYFNQSKTLTHLCELFLTHIDNGQPGFRKEAIWNKMFPGEAYDDVNFRKYNSDLMRQVEGFMAQEIIARDNILHAVNVLEFVAQRRLEPMFQGAFRQALAELDKVPYRSIEYYHQSYIIERKYYSMMDFDVKLDVRSNVEKISQNLDLFYWIEKLKLYSAVLSQKKTRNYEYNLDFIREITEYLQKFKVEEVPELAVYFYAYLTLKDEENVDHYYNLRRLLDTYGTTMPQEEAIELYESALHYCTGRLNRGDRIFYQEYFDLFEGAIKKGIFLTKGELASWRFNNIIGVALRLGKLEWAETFIENFKNYLPADTRENTCTFNLARVYRFQGKYEKVLALLQNVEYEDIGISLISKMMLTITYYELDEQEALDSFMESFRVFLNRHKNIPQQRRRSYLNLLKYVRHLTRLAANDKTTRAKIREEIIRDKATIVNHEWLLEKLDELE